MVANMRGESPEEVARQLLSSEGLRGLQVQLSACFPVLLSLCAGPASAVLCLLPLPALPLWEASDQWHCMLVYVPLPWAVCPACAGQTSLPVTLLPLICVQAQSQRPTHSLGARLGSVLEQQTCRAWVLRGSCLCHKRLMLRGVGLTIISFGSAERVYVRTARDPLSARCTPWAKRFPC